MQIKLIFIINYSYERSSSEDTSRSGLQDVGHAGVVTRRDGSSLPSDSRWSLRIFRWLYIISVHLLSECAHINESHLVMHYYLSCDRSW